MPVLSDVILADLTSAVSALIEGVNEADQEAGSGLEISTVTAQIRRGDKPFAEVLVRISSRSGDEVIRRADVEIV